MKKAAAPETVIKIDGIEIYGNLVIPEGSEDLVIFSHGSGSSRFSPRNEYVSSVLNDNGISTFLVDLLTEKEDEIYENRFDIQLLTNRLIAVSKFFMKQRPLKFKYIGYFGASTGAASALMAAAELDGSILAVVSRGGRPDLAVEKLHDVTAPTLLIVGGKDYQVLELNEQAYAEMKCEKHLSVVPGATHLFEEPGTLGYVAQLACEWFVNHMQKNRPQT